MNFWYRMNSECVCMCALYQQQITVIIERASERANEWERKNKHIHIAMSDDGEGKGKGEKLEEERGEFVRTQEKRPIECSEPVNERKQKDTNAWHRWFSGWCERRKKKIMRTKHLTWCISTLFAVVHAFAFILCACALCVHAAGSVCQHSVPVCHRRFLLFVACTLHIAFVPLKLAKKWNHWIDARARTHRHITIYGGEKSTRSSIKSISSDGLRQKAIIIAKCFIDFYYYSSFSCSRVYCFNCKMNGFAIVRSFLRRSWTVNGLPTSINYYFPL